MSTATIPGSALTPGQFDFASRYLAETRDALIAATQALSPAQWNFKPTPECWSVAQIVEHVALVDNGVHTRISSFAAATPAPADWDEAAIDRYILEQIPLRTTRVAAPPQICPTHNWPLHEAIANFSASRQLCIGDLATPTLRGRTMPHPVAGQWDGYQWLLAAGAHSARHTNQILEIKSDPNFPSES